MRSLWTAFLVAYFSVFFAVAETQQTSPGSSLASQENRKPAQSTSGYELNSVDVTAFFDGFISMQMERSDIAGATVLVMKDDKVLLQKDYGYANWETRKPVGPTTIFRLASISKLFTWVSVMQLEEQGKLDLDADVNRYLDFQIRSAFGKPITLRNLMTHTAGFEDMWHDIVLTDPKKVPSLRDFLINNQPMRIYPPGIVPAYSNYGAGLASYIVQRVSGEPFEQYVQGHIFSPLGMTHSSFEQPLQKNLATAPSEGYRYSTEESPVGFELYTPAGAGGVSSTSADMGRFGRALLHGGELDGERILRPETLAAMWTPQFRANEHLPPICMGFYEMSRNNLHWLGHGGDLIAFHSHFFMEPKQNLVLFVSYNSKGAEAKTRSEVIDLFSDRYFPGDNRQAFISLSRKEIKSIEGYYLDTRHTASNRAAILNPILYGSHATVDENGTLTISGMNDLRGHLIKWMPIDRDLWQEVGGQQHIFIIRNSQGRVLRLAYDSPYNQYERMPWYEDSTLVLLLGEGCIVVLAAVVLAPISRSAWRVVMGKRPLSPPQAGTEWLPWVTQLTAGIWVVTFSVVVGFVLMHPDDMTLPKSGWEKYFYLTNGVTALALALSVFTMILSIRIWRRAELRRITKVKFSVVALSCLILSWFSIHYHLIGSAIRF